MNFNIVYTNFLNLNLGIRLEESFAWGTILQVHAQTEN